MIGELYVFGRDAGLKLEDLESSMHIMSMSMSIGQTTIDHTYVWGPCIIGCLLKFLCWLHGACIIAERDAPHFGDGAEPHHHHIFSSA
jgi:hypothetical protein